VRTVRIGVLGLLTISLVVLSQGSTHSQGGRTLSAFVGATIEGIVSSVVDGDTFDMVLDGSKRTTRVRVFGIDAPENGEPFSAMAVRRARVLLLDQRVRVTGRDVDQYGRLVGTVVSGGQDIGTAMLSAGLACHFTRYSNDASLATAEAAARRSGAGFWAPGAAKPACTTRQQRTAAGPFRGNSQSRVYHAPTCPNYACKNCTQVFQTEAAAREAGFRPAGDCLR
jgi:micrococcal nuclease